MTEDEIKAAAAQIKELERLANQADEEMYDARPSEAKDYKDDACHFLYQASELAKRAGLDSEAARLIARRDHIMAVWDSQFRGVGR